MTLKPLTCPYNPALRHIPALIKRIEPVLLHLLGVISNMYTLLPHHQCQLIGDTQGMLMNGLVRS